MECIEVRDTIIYIEPSIANQVQEKCSKHHPTVLNIIMKETRYKVFHLYIYISKVSVNVYVPSLEAVTADLTGHHSSPIFILFTGIHVIEKYHALLSIICCQH
ncbi:uncharacterized protein LOC127290854 [Leptopilina boulardi]|uniref:uncharacterized protein LOC127290854 n=1 Tax=Leptopilina boulardi TaxID=63433 RepID=UPI0021F5B0D2|nr:uncharacterized protein LOC127290854 [Leptopilina boulardi]